MSSNAKLSIEEEFLLLLCKHIDSELAYKVRLGVIQRSPSVVKIEVNPYKYTSAASFYYDYCLASFLSKWKGWSKIHSSNTYAVALAGWIASESKCASTNARLKSYRWPYGRIPADQPASAVIIRAKDKIRKILGRFDLDRALSYCDWTSGATAETRRSDPLSKKISGPLAVTERAAPYLRKVIDADLHWSANIIGTFPEGPVSVLPRYTLVKRESNRFLTVPKTAKTDRCIAAEPAGNVFLQKGAGTYIAKCLHRHGVRKDQVPNQHAAQIAQRCGLATLDLSAASDTVSIEIVRLLLPDDWFDYLSDLRCQYSRIDGKDVLLSKFANMGNAYTFELETLIFYALASAAEELTRPTPPQEVATVLSFGDDIIVPTYAVDLTIQALEFAGFAINKEKSFVSPSRFFESCGHHYFDSVYVTPIYQKEIVKPGTNSIEFFNRVVRLLDNELWDHFPALRDEAIGFLRTRFGITKRAVQTYKPDVPFMPYGVLGDLGYLVPKSWIAKFDKNHGYKCRVRSFVSSLPRSRASQALLAYKFRSSRKDLTPSPLGRVDEIPSSAFTNPDPRGRDVDVRLGHGTWVYKFQYIQPWADFSLTEPWMTS